MKYKLINRKTKEETICAKVNVDGFDYYVSNSPNDLGGWHIDVELKLLSNTSRYNVVDEMREVIATNNPNIDIPKVVDEVEGLAKKQWGNVHRTGVLGFKEGYNKHKETNPFSEEDMIEFAVWLVDVLSFDNYHKETPRKELLELWKEQKVEIIYYE